MGMNCLKCFKKRDFSTNKKWCAAVVLCCSFIVITKYWRENTLTTKYADLSEPRYVYFWNRPNWIKTNLFENCNAHCQLVENPFHYNQSDAVIFHIPALGTEHPPVKLPNQIWVAYFMETPYRIPNIPKNWRYLFNWTMSYRRDSDILAMLGSFKRRKNRPDISVKNSKWDAKVREISWIVSNCRTPSRREEYVVNLQKYVNVHTYGKCGINKCPHTKKPFNDSCLAMVDDSYKFYLSFENSFCMDYLTEKVFNIYRLNSVIPVVRGGVDYDLYLPPGSYISASNFPNAKSLGRHILKLLGKNELSFQPFLYKQFYTITPDDRNFFCDLCERLHLKVLPVRLYDDFDKWLRVHNGLPTCQPPRDLH